MNAEHRQFFETFVTLSDDDRSQEAVEFFENAGLTVLKVKSGLFVSGGAKEFEYATGVDPNSPSTEVKLPVPHSLRDIIQSIDVNPVPDYN